MVTTNEYSTPLSLSNFMVLTRTIPNHKDNAREIVGTGNSSKTIFWLDNLGVIENTYVFSYGADEENLTTLAETTHYTLDLALSKLTLTASGVTAVASNIIWGEYKYNSAGVLNAELIKQLNAAENKVIRDTEQTFANGTATNPLYKKVADEPIKGHLNPSLKVYDLFWTPLVKLQTTVNGAFTLGGTTLTLTSGTGFPNTGTIYIGGNKVSYTAKSTNDLTVPNTTPTIADGATVRGEVVELSTVPEGTTPSYSVLDPDTEYEVDYDQGRFKPLQNAYFGEVSSTDRVYPTNYLLRVTYMHAWHDLQAAPSIPDEIEWVVNAIAARKLMGSIVAKAHTLGLNEFNPSLLNVDRAAIQEVLDEYATLNVSTSNYNKQYLS